MGSTPTTADDLTPIGLGDDEVHDGLAAFLAHRRRYLIGVRDHRPSDSGDHLRGTILAHEGLNRVRGR